MAWSITNPFTALLQTDMPSGATSQASLFATIGAWINALAGLIPTTTVIPVAVSVTAANTYGTATANFPAGRYSSPPACIAFVQNVSDSSVYTVGVTSITSTSVTVNAKRTTSGAGTIVVTVFVIASP